MCETRRPVNQIRPLGPSYAMALSTPRQPASRGLDDPGLRAVFPQPRTGEEDVSHRDTTTGCRQCHTSPVAGHSRRARDHTMMRPCRGGGVTVPATVGGLKASPKLRCAVVWEVRKKKISFSVGMYLLRS